MPSVLQAWVADLPLRAQGTLLTAVRGCDLTPKYPLDSTERQLVGAIRHAFLVPADPREVDAEPGSFFRTEVPVGLRPSALGHYPWHWLSHIVHAIEVLGYCHPDSRTRLSWFTLYVKFVHSFHMTIESREEWERRMGEDRIEAGTVVS